MSNCPHCGMIHQTTCPRIKAIEYNADGVTVKRVEFHPPQPVVTPRLDRQITPSGFSNSWGHHASGIANSCEQNEGA